MMIRSIHGIVAHSVDNLDPLVRAFVTAAVITDSAIRVALNTFVLTLRANNLLSKFDAIYPFVGGSAFTHKFNLMNAADSDVAFRLSFVGGYVHNANGINPNGINTYANTFYKETDHSLINDKHISIYSRTNSTGFFNDMGANSSSVVVTNSTSILTSYTAGGGTRCFMTNSSQTSSFFTNTDSRGFYLNNRTDSAQLRSFKNNALQVQVNPSTGLVPWNYYINALNAADVAAARSVRNLSFASIGRSFTDVEAVIFYNAVQTLQTTLGRAV